MFINLNKFVRGEITPSRLHPKQPIIRKSTFIDHNDYTIYRKPVDYRIKPLTSEQVENIKIRLCINNQPQVKYNIDNNKGNIKRLVKKKHH